jgi:hypothetical protein
MCSKYERQIAENKKKLRWQEVFKGLGFKQDDLGSFKGLFEGIQVSAIEDPILNEVVVTAIYVDSRTAIHFDTSLSLECSRQDLCSVLVRIFEKVFPERVRQEPSPPPKQRPSFPEALVRVPELLHQAFDSLNELQFLFGRSFAVEGSLKRSFAEIAAAYVYDLNLEADDRESVRSADGRGVQLIAVNRPRGIVRFSETPRHILLVHLRGQELVEEYNGPADVLLEAAAGCQDGDYRISFPRIRGCREQVPAHWRLPLIRSLGSAPGGQ